jgi:hypothetical protein
VKGANIQRTGSGMKLKMSIRATWNALHYNHTIAPGIRLKSAVKAGQILLNDYQTLALGSNNIC